MQSSIICKVALFAIFAFPNATLADFKVRIIERGIVFNNPTKSTISEVELCQSTHCIFVEKRELDLLNINLGDNTNTIFNSIKSMDDLQKAWIFFRIEQLNRPPR